MGRTLVIAECGSSWDCDLSKAFRLIEAAKECGADVAKFQWTSNAFAIARRRGLGADAAAMYVKYLQYPVDTLRKLKAHCDEVGIEFMCTVYLIEDIAVIAPLVQRYKVSAFEAGWYEFTRAYSSAIVSCNTENQAYNAKAMSDHNKTLYCVSEYPTPLERLKLSSILADGVGDMAFDGLSDHTTGTLTGALAVAAGATIVEKHIRLPDTSPDNPDYGHSLCCADDMRAVGDVSLHQFNTFKDFVDNIRIAERAM